MLHSPIISILSLINLIPRIDTYFFKIYSNILLAIFSRSLSHRFAYEHTNILSFWLRSLSYGFNHPDNIKWTVQKKKFLIVKPFPSPILISFRPKYSHLNPVLKYLRPHSSLKVRNHTSQLVLLLYTHVFLFSNSCREVEKNKVFVLNNNRNIQLWVNLLYDKSHNQFFNYIFHE